MTTQKTIAKHLLDIGAVFLRPNDPFTWASGILSPIYCDNRLVLSFPIARKEVEQALADIIITHYPQCEMLMGTSTAGIAHAAIVATILNLPMGYVRASSKDHGRTNQIEGSCPAGTKVVVIEDLISTGGSVVDVVDVLRDHGCDVLGIASIFTYGLTKGIERLKDAKVKNVSASNFDALIDVAIDMSYIEASDKDKLLAFRSNPSDQSWMR